MANDKIVPFALARRLREERRRLGEDVEQFALRLGVSSEQLRAWEAGTEQPGAGTTLAGGSQEAHATADMPQRDRDLFLPALEQLLAHSASAGEVVAFDMARRIRRERRRQGDSLEQFARRLGVTTEKLRAWEAGREQPDPKVRLVLDPRRVYSVYDTPDWLRDFIIQGLEKKLAELSNVADEGDEDS